jgi:catechol 2,3-dioxygenase-like lactoylglutathione lyase family enzyme
LAHVELTVPDPEVSSAWYQRVLGFSLRGDRRTGGVGVIVFEHESGIVLGFWKRKEEPALDRFDEFRTGLDHLAFEVATRGDIDDWVAHFEGLGVEYSQPVDIGPYGLGLTFRDPDNIQLEVYGDKRKESPVGR